MNNVGVIGAGYWGIKIVDEYTQLGCKVTVADKDEAIRKKCVDKFGAEVTGDMRDLLNNDAITAINICTPNASHYKLAKACLEAGKNVMVEKPFTVKPEDAEDLARIAAEKGLVVVVGHIFRFNNAIQTVRKMVEYGEFGKIYMAKLRWTNLERPFDDRDVIYDLAPHAFDIIHFLFNRNPDPETISAYGNAYRADNFAEAVFITGLLNDVMLHIELSWLTPKKERVLEIIGANKSAIVECLHQRVEVYEDGGWKELEVVPNNTIRAELEAFLGNINNKNESIAGPQIGIDNVRLLKDVKNKMISS